MNEVWLCSKLLFKLAFILVFLVVVPTACDEKKIERDYLYSPYFEFKPRNWMTLEDAQKAPKFFGTLETSRFANKEQTPEQKKAADDFINKVVEKIESREWYNIDKVKADGFVFEPQKDYSHFPSYTHLYDNENLNPEKPEYLMFHQTSDGKWVLTGVMFMIEDLFAHGEQIGGPETVWHFHDYAQEEGGGRCDIWFKIPEGHRYTSQVNYDKCKKGVFVTRSPEMLHVWFVDHHEGRFGTTMMVNDQSVRTSRFFAQSTGTWIDATLNQGDLTSHQIPALQHRH